VLEWLVKVINHNNCDSSSPFVGLLFGLESDVGIKEIANKRKITMIALLG
jgi:hypothetical protein